MMHDHAQGVHFVLPALLFQEDISKNETSSHDHVKINIFAHPVHTCMLVLPGTDDNILFVIALFELRHCLPIWQCIQH